MISETGLYRSFKSKSVLSDLYFGYINAHPGEPQRISISRLFVCPSTILMQTSQPQRRGTRTRTSSLLSSSSRISLGSLLEVSKTPSTSSIDQYPQTYGSFIPLPSAITTLKGFASSSNSLPLPPRRRRRVTFAFDERSPQSSDNEASNLGPKIPYITRTQPSSPIFPPSPTSSSSSLMQTETPRSNIPSDLHPILASLERKSRICTRVTQCSTCGKPGADFPRCSKCGDMWCSRPCRLVDGKRHICSSIKVQ